MKGLLGRGFGGLIILLLAAGLGVLMALSPDLALPLALLLLPGLIAVILDRSAGCGLAQAILLFQATACVGPVREAWFRCVGIDGCMGLLTDRPTLLRVWLAAAVAWLVMQLLPLGLKMLEDRRMRLRLDSLTQHRAALSEEWGLGDE